MRSDHSFLQLVAVSTLVVSALIAALTGQNIGSAFVWAAWFFAFSSLVSVFHHKRAHLVAAKDAALISLASSLAVLTGVLAVIVLSYAALPFSSVSAVGLMGLVALVTGFVGLFVFQYAYAFRVEPTHRMLMRSFVSSVVLAIVCMAIAQVWLAIVVHDNLQMHDRAVPQLVPAQFGTDAQRAALSGTRLGSALASYGSDLRGSMNATRVPGCSGVFIDTSRCTAVVTNDISSVARFVVKNLMLERAYALTANDSNVSSAPLSSEDLRLLASARYTPDPRIAILTARSLDGQAAPFSTRGLMLIDPALSGTDAFHASLARLADSTSVADAVARFVAGIIDENGHYAEYRSIYVAGVLVSNDPSLATDPGFIRFARASLDEYQNGAKATS